MTPQCLDVTLWAAMKLWQNIDYLKKNYMEPVPFRHDWLVKAHTFAWRDCIGTGPYIRHPETVIDERKYLMEVAAWIITPKGYEVLAVRKSMKGTSGHMWRWVKKNDDRLVSLKFPERKKISGREYADEFMEPIIARCAPEATRYMNMVAIHRDDLRRAKKFDTSRCFWCAVELKSARTCDWCSLEEDHWIPKYYGGTNRQVNIVPSCRRCNQFKLALMPDVWLDKVKVGIVKTHRCELKCANVEYKTINWRALRSGVCIMNVLGIYGDIDYWGWGIISVDDDAPAATPSYVACGTDRASTKQGSGVFKQIAELRDFFTRCIFDEYEVGRVVMCTKTWRNLPQASKNGVLVGFIAGMCAERGVTDVYEGAHSSIVRCATGSNSGATAEGVTEAMLAKLRIEDPVHVMAGQALATAYWSWRANKAGIR